MKKLKIFLGYTALFFTLNTICKTLTDNFSIHHLVKPSPSGSKWEVPDQQDPLNLLSQSYTYLGKGQQAYVFVSEDGEHVLKLFKSFFPKYHLSFGGKNYKIGLSKLPFLQTIFAALYPEENSKQKELDFQSYMNSYYLLREQTKLEYVHLTKTSHFSKKLKIYDKIGVLHYLDLNNTCFLLQKKTDLFYPTLSNYIQKKEEDKAKELIKGYITLSFEFLSKGIINPTTVEKNFGCIGLTPIQIDVGRVLTKKDLPEALEPSFEDIYPCTHHLKKWLLQKSPSLAEYLAETIEEERKCYELQI